MTSKSIPINDPRAQAFIRDLIYLCHRHRVRVGGAADYSLELKPLAESDVLEATVDDTTFYQPPERPFYFDLKTKRDES